MLKEGRTLISKLLSFIPKKWKVREEVKAQGEGQLAIGEGSLPYFSQRLGWSEEAARYLATAFTFGVKENVAAVLEKAQELHQSEEFEYEFLQRVREDPSILGATLEASKFISSDELRNLLGRILAGDLHKPGSVSRRAVSIAQDLTPEQLEEFLLLRAVAWYRVDEETDARDGPFLVMGTRVGMYDEGFLSFDSDEIGISYYAFGELQQLGLLQERPYGARLSLTKEETTLVHGNRSVTIRHIESGTSLQLGMYILTRPGVEIADLFMNNDYPALDGYFEEVCQYWRNKGVEVIEENIDILNG